VTTTSESTHTARATAKPSRLLWLQVALTLAAFGYLLHITDLAKLAQGLREAPAWSMPAAIGMLLAVMFANTVRWQLLLQSYGARTQPRLSQLFRLQLIGLFYNMMPGAVGGDVLRGVISRHSFGPRGMSAGIAVVLVERVFGLMSLMLLVIGVLALHPIRSLQLSPWVFAIGSAGSAGTLFAIALGRRLAPHLPKPLSERAANLPALDRPWAFGAALLVSVLTQVLVGVMGHLTIMPMAPQVALSDSLVLSPLAFAAIFFPLTVAGAATRDAAMVALYGLLGVAREQALTASLQILLAYIVVAAIGGMLSAFTQLELDAPDASA
jgi:uncharacterized membrane protein YbhN (UPF0104 family)